MLGLAGRIGIGEASEGGGEQLPVPDFPLGSGSVSGLEGPVDGGSPAARGLEGAARPGAGTGGDLCGSGEVPGDLLPCGQLAVHWSDEGTQGECIGGRQETPKDVYLYPLTQDWKQVLLTGTRRTGRRSRSRSPATVLAPEDAFVRLWSGIVETLVGVANRHDRIWQRRRRVLNTLVVVLFIFRLVFSKGRPAVCAVET